MLDLISICIPTLNGGKFLQEALDSVNKQTYNNFEVIISDDASSDQTLGIAQDFKKEVDFPVHIFNHEPSGIGANWNNCIKNANGKFIKFLFQDDLLKQNCIEEQIKIFDNNSNKIGIVACKRNLLVEGVEDDLNKKWIEDYHDLQKNLDLPPNKISILTQNLFRDKNFLNIPRNKVGEPSTVLFPKTLVEQVGYFREDLYQSLDYEFYYRVLKKKHIAIINKKLVSFRLHPLQATNINRNKPIKDYEFYERILYEDFFWYLSYSEKKRLFFKFNRIGKITQRLENANKRRS